MPSTYTLNNGIELIGTGEQSGTWGDTTNTNLSLIDVALDGQVTVTLASAGTSGSPNTLPISDGATSDGRNRMVIFADGGDIGATAYVQLTPNDAEKIIYVRNSLSGSRSIILFQGTYNASNDYELPAGTTAVIYFNGGGAGAVAANVFNNAHFDAMNVVGNVEIGGTLSVTGAGLTVDDKVFVEGGNPYIAINDTDVTDLNTMLRTQSGVGYINTIDDAYSTIIRRFSVDHATGDISFYEDTGTTAKFFWDASAESLGIGTSSPETDLSVSSSGAGAKIFVGRQVTSGNLSNTAAGGSIEFGSADSSTYTEYSGAAIKLLADQNWTVGSAQGSALAFSVTADGTAILSEAMRIISSGNVGIGTDAPTGDLDIYRSTTDPDIRLTRDTTQSRIATSSTGGLRLQADYGNTAADSFIQFSVDGSEAMRIISDGKLGIGTISPATALDVVGTITSDGLTVDGDVEISAATAALKMFETDSTDLNTYLRTGNGEFRINTADDAGVGTAERFTIDHATGDISFYEDTGTTAKFFWDASAERLVIGDNTVSPAADAGDLVVGGSTGNNGITIGAATTGTGSLRFADSGGTGRGIVLYDHSTDYMAFHSAGGERMRIDSSGNVGIGTSSPSGNLHISGSGDRSLLITGGTAGTTSVQMGDSSDQDAGAIKYDNSNNSMQFFTNASEAMRIDSDGKLLVGKTSDDNTALGLVVNANGYTKIVRASATANVNTVLSLNRLTTDGDIAVFQKDGTTLGSIGASNDALYIGTGDTTLKFAPASDVIAPTGTNGATRDGVISLGNSSNRFEDLFLSGGVYLGGTGASNLLDDYEEGTWTPVPVDAATGGNEGSASQSRGIYTKVGNLVTVTVSLVNIDTTGMTAGNDFRVGGLPFTAQSYTTPNMFFSGGVWGAYIAHTGTLTATVADNEDTIRLTEFGDNANTDTVTVSQVTSGTADLYFNITYRTSA